MKRNITVNIFGSLYPMDEDAYALLNAYITNMRGYFSRQPAGSDKYSAVPSDVEFYLDGKKITDDELKALDPSAIASIDVSRHENRISITSK